MEAFAQQVLSQADYFLLLLLRVGALFFNSPIFGRINIPVLAKTAFCFALTVFFFIAFPQQHPIEYSSLFGFALLCVLELLLGAVLAFVTNLFFTLVFISGHMIDMQIGFGIVNVYDQQNNTQIPMVGNLYNIILLLCFFIADQHLRLIELVATTIARLPVGGVRLSPDLGLVALEVFARAFLMGVSIALPVIASGLILELAFGVLGRTVPQMNMFVVGIPLKLLVGFVVLFISLPAFVQFSGTIFDNLFNGVEQMFNTFNAS